MRKKEREMSLSDEVIADLIRIARSLNTSTLSEEEYHKNGGKFHFEELDEDFGGFANYCALAGIKCEKEKFLL